MDCKISAEKVIDFQFGVIDEADRDAVEHHLAQCPECLWEYFALKRDIDGQSSAAILPSAKTRLGVLQEFEAFRQRILPEESRLWIHEHKGRLIAAGMLAAAALLFLLLTRWVPSAETRGTHPDTMRVHTLDESVDTGRLSPEHINIL